PPQTRRGGCAMKKELRSHISAQTGWCDQLQYDSLGQHHPGRSNAADEGTSSLTCSIFTSSQTTSELRLYGCADREFVQSLPGCRRDRIHECTCSDCRAGFADTARRFRAWYNVNLDF